MKPDYKTINVPEDSIWGRKTYNPYILLDRWVYRKLRHTIIGGYFCQMFDNINAFVRGVKNIVKWAPTIYKDNDWDYTSIYTIMQKKIEFNRDLIVKNNRHTGVQSDNFWMTLTLNLTQRVKDEAYSTEYFDYIEKNHDFEEIGEKSGDGQNLYRMVSEVVYDNTEKYVQNNPSKVRLLRKTIEDFDSMSNEDKAREIGNAKHEQAKRILFGVLQNKIEYWWD
jgi:hypothetical protein